MIEQSPYRPVLLETARYILRSVVADDASESWGRWLNDPTTARWLNAQAREASREELRHYISTFDDRDRFLVGVFEKSGGRLIGIHAIYVDWPRSEYSINVMIGESDARNQGARSEARIAVHNHFMETLGLEHSVCTVLEGHPQLPQMARWGWIAEGKTQRPSANGGLPVSLLKMRLTREAWRRAQTA